MTEVMMKQHIEKIAERLREVCRHFVVRFAYPSFYSDGELALAAFCNRDEAGRPYLEISVACSPRLRRGQWGIEWSVFDRESDTRVCHGYTNQYTHFQLTDSDLAPGKEYRLEIRPTRPCAVRPERLPDPIEIPITFPLGARSSQSDPVFEFVEESERIRIRGHTAAKNSPERLLVTATFPAQLVSDGLLRYELRRRPEDGGGLVRAGFIGMYPDPAQEGTCYGEVNLDLSKPALRYLAFNHKLLLLVPRDACLLTELSPADWLLIQDALNATPNLRCEKVLKQVLEKLEKLNQA